MNLDQRSLIWKKQQHSSWPAWLRRYYLRVLQWRDQDIMVDIMDHSRHMLWRMFNLHRVRDIIMLFTMVGIIMHHITTTMDIIIIGPARVIGLLRRQYCYQHWYKEKPPKRRFNFYGRGDRNRTCDPLHPMQVLYQAELRPDNANIIV